MNSVERMTAALRREQPDRVPIAELVIDERVARAIDPSFTDVADAMDRLDLDSIYVGPTFNRMKEGGGCFTDEWGVTYSDNGVEALPHPLRGPIETMADAQAYTPPDPDAPYRLDKLRDIVARYKGKRAIMFGCRAEFIWSVFLMGMDNFLPAMLAEPELATLVMDKVLEANMRVAYNAIKAGADIILLGDDYAYNSGPLVSPALFKEYLQPRMAKMVQMIKNEGAFTIKHTDGYIYPIMEMMVETGIDGLNPIEPAAGMEMKEVKRLVGDRVCLMGNIDVSHLLPHGTPEQVEEAVAQAIRDGGEGGGLIISSSNSIHSSVKPENYVAMVKAAKRYGEYPTRHLNR